MAGDLATELAGKYRVLGKLGTGAGGDTYEAIAEIDGTKVALKRLVLANTSDWKKVDLFQREARVLASLSHPAIPRYRESFVVESPNGPISYLAHDFAPGKSLRGWIESGWRPDEAEILRIGAFLLDVLAYLHGLHPAVIHRDIKPANVIRGDDGRLWLVDFGAIHDAGVSGGSTVVGTYGYMAPEQFRGAAVPASDIYGVAGTLLYLLGGKAPTDYAQVKLTIDFKSQVRVSPFLATWLERALEPAPEERFPNALEALAVLRGQKRLAPPNGTPKRGRGRLVALLGLLGLIVVGTGGYIGWDLWKARHLFAQQPKAAKAALRPVTRLPLRPLDNYDYLINVTVLNGKHDEMITALAISPDDKRIVTADKNAIKLWDVSQGAALATLPALGASKIGSIAYTHDGTRFLVAGGHAVRIANAEDGKPLATIVVPDALELALTADDKTVFVGDHVGNSVRSFDLATQKPGRTFTHGSPVYGVALAPDGKLLASGAKDGTVKLWSTDTGALVSSWTPHDATVGSVAFSPDGSLIASCADDGYVSVQTLGANHVPQLRYEVRHTDECWSATFSHDGKQLASAGKDGNIIIVDAQSGKMIGYRYWTDYIANVVYTHDDATLFSSIGLWLHRLDPSRHGRGTVLPTPDPGALATVKPRDRAHDLYLTAERQGAFDTVGWNKAAEKTVAAALAIKPPSPLAWIARARLTMREQSRGIVPRESWLQARTQLDTATTFGPKTVEWWATSAWIARSQNDSATAQDAVRQAKEIDPRDPSALLNEAGLAEVDKRWPNVITIATEIIRGTQRPEVLTGAYQFLARAYAHLGDLDAADSAHRARIALEPQDFQAHRDYSAFLGTNGDMAGCLREAQAGYAIAPWHANVTTELAWALAKDAERKLWDDNDLDGAAATYEEAIKLNPKEASVYYGRAAIARARAFDRHDPSLLEGARTDLERAISLYPAFGFAKLALGELDRVAVAVAVTKP